jgi:trk system potassium uptake protein
VHVVIAGCGRVGSELSSNLERLGHSVAVIDKNRKAFDRLPPAFNGRALTGLAFDRRVLEDAGIRDATAFASVTNGDNSNIVSARVAREHYKIPQVVARIYDPRRAQIYQRLGIRTVATVRWATDQILRHLLPEEVSVEHTVENGEVLITAMPVPVEAVGKKALDIDEPGRRRVIAVSRLGVPRIPDAELSMQEDDVIYVSVVREEAGSLFEAIKALGESD